MIQSGGRNDGYKHAHVVHNMSIVSNHWRGVIVFDTAQFEDDNDALGA